MIPQIIHFCWFGNQPYPSKIKKYIESWRKHLPHYEYKLWNEQTFEIDKCCQYVKDAYKEKKYAFVSDYVRLYALYNYGGIYLDTDIEIIKEIPTNILNHKLIFSLDEEGYIAGSFIASQKNNVFLHHMINFYHKLSFYKIDGSLNLEVNNTYIQQEIINKGYNYEQINKLQVLNDDIILYPDDFFHCRSLTTGEINITTNSIAIHWHSILWASNKTKIINFLRINIIVPLIGSKLYTKLTNKIKNGKTTI